MKQFTFRYNLVLSLSIAFTFLSGLSSLIAQGHDSTYYFKGYAVHAAGGGPEGGALSLFKGNQIISRRDYDSDVLNLQIVDFNNDNNPKIVARLYSGGAHCCFTIMILDVQNDSLVQLASKDISNSDFAIKDLDRDGKKEIVFFDDRFAYEFTSFAESRFFVEVDHFENGQLLPLNKSYRDFVLKDIEQHKAELEKIMKTGTISKSNLPYAEALLAAITGDYFSLGNEQKGFDLINRLYNGADKDQFVAFLRLKLGTGAPTTYSEFMKLNK